MSVTSGPLLSFLGGEWRDWRYTCVACRAAGRQVEQIVSLGPDDVPPGTMRLPCHEAERDTGAWLKSVPMHLHVLAKGQEPPPKR
jgi:hypothetical protein